jgi:hypothetical protein
MDQPHVIRFSNKTDADTVVRFECKKGYRKVSGSEEVRCYADSLAWSDADLVCIGM